jgi:hypothetical protein
MLCVAGHVIWGMSAARISSMAPFRHDAKEPMTGGYADFADGDHVLGVATILQWDGTSMRSSGVDGQEGLQFFRFRARIAALGVEPYEVTFDQAVSGQWILEHRVQLRFDPRWRVAVRIRKDDRTGVQIAFDVDPRFIPVKPISLRQIRTEGEPCEVIVLSAEPWQPPMTLDDASAAWHFELTVIPTSGEPYRTGSTDVVSPARLPHIYPGSRLPARVVSREEPPAIDWPAIPGAPA